MSFSRHAARFAWSSLALALSGAALAQDEDPPVQPSIPAFEDPLPIPEPIPPFEQEELEEVPEGQRPLQELLPPGVTEPLRDRVRDHQQQVPPLRERLPGEPWRREELRMPIQDLPPPDPTEELLPYTGDPTEAATIQAQPVPGSPIEITVWGPAAVRQARSAVVREMQGLGYTAHDRGGGLWVFRPPERWMGRVRLEPDGRLTFLRPVVAFRNVQASQRPELQEMRNPGMARNPNFDRDPMGARQPVRSVPGQPVTDETGLTMPPIEGWMWFLPSMSRLEPIREQVRERVEPRLEEFRQVRQNTLLMDRIVDVRASLRALWNEGQPIQGEAGTLPTMEARRRAALAFWATRLSTPEGLVVSEMVEDWLRTVVMQSGDPVTLEEVRWAEAMRQDGRPLQIDAE